MNDTVNKKTGQNPDLSRVQNQGAETPPWLQEVPEDVEIGASALTGKKALVLTSLAAIIVVVGFVAMIFYAREQSAVTDKVRHIAAPADPIKEKPENPGGMEVPHQDKDVLEVAATGAAETDDAQLGSLPEQPVDDVTAAAAEPEPVVAPEITANNEPADKEIAASGTESVSKDAPPQIAEPQNNAAVSKPVDANASGEEASKASISPAEPEPVDANVNQYRIQLGAFSDEAGAKAAWRRARGKGIEALTALSPTYESVNTGSRSLVRLRAGGLNTRAQADAACLAVRAKDLPCMVVNPPAPN